MHGIKAKYFTFQLDKICKPGNTLIIGDRKQEKHQYVMKLLIKL